MMSFAKVILISKRIRLYQSIFLYINQSMNGITLNKQVNLRLSEPVFKHLKRLAHDEDLKVSDMIRKAIKQTYGAPKKQKTL